MNPNYPVLRFASDHLSGTGTRPVHICDGRDALRILTSSPLPPLAGFAGLPRLPPRLPACLPACLLSAGWGGLLAVVLVRGTLG